MCSKIYFCFFFFSNQVFGQFQQDENNLKIISRAQTTVVLKDSKLDIKICRENNEEKIKIKFCYCGKSDEVCGPGSSLIVFTSLEVVLKKILTLSKIVLM